MHDFNTEALARSFSTAGICAQEAAENIRDFSRRMAEIDYSFIEDRATAWYLDDKRSFDAAVFRVLAEGAYSVKAPGGEAPSLDFLYGALHREEEEPDPLALRPLAEAIQSNKEQRSYLVPTEQGFR